MNEHKELSATDEYTGSLNGVIGLKTTGLDQFKESLQKVIELTKALEASLEAVSASASKFRVEVSRPKFYEAR